MYTCVHTFI